MISIVIIVIIFLFYYNKYYRETGNCLLLIFYVSILLLSLFSFECSLRGIDFFASDEIGYINTACNFANGIEQERCVT